MKSDFKVAEDGAHVETWAAGSEHDTAPQLARDLIGAGVAETVVGEEKKPGPRAPAAPKADDSGSRSNPERK